MATRAASRMPAAAAARVDMRDILRVNSVDSYLRNFVGEPQRLQELLEVTLSYGIYCVSRNFQLKGMTIDELRTVTKHEKTKNQDYFVRNGPTKQRGILDAQHTVDDPQQLYVKPPTSWRSGNAKAETRDDQERAMSGQVPVVETPIVPEVFFLPNEAHKDKLDEIDFYTRLLGKPLVDVAWTTYSGRASSYLTPTQLDERMLRVDQRKRPDLIPQTEYPVCSFVQFLNAYVKKSVARTSSHGDDEDRAAVETTAVDSVKATTTQPPSTKPSRAAEHSLHELRTSQARPGSARRPIRDSPRGRENVAPQGPKGLENVRSKIQPELRAHREKLLRVKKTQAQLMRESLARTRLSEYAARHGDDVGEALAKPPFTVKRMPLDKITPGAAALEIVDDFMRSPLMDKFGSDPRSAMQHGSERPRNDPLKQELYGMAAHDDSFIGCKVPASSRKSVPKTTKQTTASRDYSGWLGDFGPPHTKTVKPTWASDAPAEFQESEDGHGDGSGRPLSQPQVTEKRDRYEWKFDMLDTTKQQKARRSTEKTNPPSSKVSGSVSDDDDQDIGSVSDDWSGAQSDTSDQVFHWIKTAVS